MGTATSMMMGVADMPIQTLKLLNIHPDSRAGKGKQKATSDGATSVGEPSAAGTPAARTITNASRTDSASPDTPGTATHRSTFMSQAFAESAQGSRSSSRERARSRSNSAASPAPATPGPGLVESVESAVDTGKGLARILGAGFKSPMDFSLNVAKGLHNVPKLYGAEVRQVDKVTDFQSGLRTAAKVWFVEQPQHWY